MLFFLSGNIQTGKTRWLQNQVDVLECEGIRVCGVIAPGRWIDHGADAGPNRFEKAGIDNLLLPDRVIVPFARRRDLAREATAREQASQASRAKLGWMIDDAAIDRVNAHFKRLQSITNPGKRLLVVDELGTLELVHDGGLGEAVRLIERGATSAFPHALVVVRESLFETARERFAGAPWNGTRVIRPVQMPGG